MDQDNPRANVPESRFPSSPGEYRELFIHAPIGIFTSMPDGRLPEVNPALAGMFGFDSVREMLESVTDIAGQLHAEPSERDEFIRLMQKKGEVLNHECRCLRRDGSTFRASVNARVLRDHKGQVYAYQGFVTDISEHKYAQKELQDISERKRAEEELLKNSQLLREMEKVSGVGGWEYNAHTGRITWTEGTYRIHAVSPRDFDPNRLPRNIRFYAPEDQAAIDNAFAKAVEQGVPYDLELCFSNAAGERLWVRTIGKPEQENGRVVRVYGNIMDVTERKRMEKALSHSHYLMRYVIEHANSAVAVHDKEFRYIYVSRSYLEQYKIKEEDVLGRHHYEVFPDLPQSWKDAHKRALKGEVTGADRDPFYGPDGSLEWARWECRPWYDADDSIGGFIVYTEIITDRINEEQALQESERRFRDLLEDVEMVAVQGYDENRRVIFWNRASELLYGYTKKEARGAKLEDLIIPEHMRDQVIRNIQGWLEKGEAIPAGELVLKRKDGFPVPVYSSHVMQEKSNGEKELFCIDVDLTEIKKINDQLIRAKENAEAANRSKSEFLANMSHEIRTPLNGIMGMHQLLQATELDGEQGEYLNMAQNASRRLTRLLSDILDLSRIESGKMELKEEEIVLAEIKQSVRDIFQHTCEKNRNNLQIIMGDSLPEKLIGDGTRLIQVLFNLVGNALKYTRNGEVSLQIFPLSGKKPETSRLLFVIKDNGPGIPDDKIEHIFETFTQAGDSDSPYARQYEGAGLGLPLVRRVVQLMGGNLSVVSWPGTGTEVYVSLPFKLPRSGRREGGTYDGEATSSEIQGSRVLVVDDEPTTRLYISRLLQKKGVDVSVARDGQEALDMLARESFDCMLMDVQMPVMDGVQATKKIRSSRADFKNIPVIALTAYAMSGDRDKFLQAGMDDYLAKPVEKDNLMAVLKKHLPWARA